MALFIITGIFILSSGVDKNIFSLSNLEQNQMWVRREIYRRELGPVGRYNLGNSTVEQIKLVQDEFIRKVAPSFDLARYFMFNYVSVYFLVLLPFFVLGMGLLLAEKFGPVLYYLGLVFLGTILVQPDLGYWLVVPLINLGILQGVLNIKKLIHD